MQSDRSNHWWTFSARGGLSLVFGVIALLFWPILELGLMGLYFGFYIFIQGVLALVAYLKVEKNRLRFPVLLESLLGIGIGTFLALMTDFQQTLFIIGFIIWGIGIGICKVIRAAFLYKSQRFFVLLGINGLLSIVLNLMIYIQSEITKEPIAWILSIYFFVYGLLMIIFGARLKASGVFSAQEEAGYRMPL